MTAKKPAFNDKIPDYRRVTFSEHGGQLIAEYHWTHYRFMFTDGQTLDVVAVRDDSDLRGAILEHHYGKTINDPKDGGIAGVARLPVDIPSPQVAARRTVRRTTPKRLQEGTE